MPAGVNANSGKKKIIFGQRLLKDQGIVFTKLGILFAEFGAHTHIHSVKIVERLKSDKSNSGKIKNRMPFL